MAIQRSGDQSAADRLNDVLVQRLQVFERSARVFKLYIHLSQLCRQQARQIGNRHVRKKIDHDYRLKGLERRDVNFE